MAVFYGDVYSKALDMETQLVAIIPENVPGGGRPTKVITLLHGITQNAKQWVRDTRIAQYAQKYGFAVLMPEVQRSFYTDMHYGLAYATYVAEELPRLAEHLFGLGVDRDHRFVAGLSMGGYGALKVGLSFPEDYAACGSFAGALDLAGILPTMDDTMKKEATAILGPGLTLPRANDLFALLADADALPPGEKPKVYVACGTKDALYPMHRSFTQALEKTTLPHLVQEWEGEHNYFFWDNAVVRCLAYFSGQTPDANPYQNPYQDRQ